MAVPPHSLPGGTNRAQPGPKGCILDADEKGEVQCGCGEHGEG